MSPRMARETASHITAEQKRFGISATGLMSLFANRGYDALGYAKWGEFVEAELRPSIDKLSDKELLALATDLRVAGCSLRAIATVVKWSHTTVKNRIGDVNGVAPTTLGADGASYRQPRSRKNYASSVLDAAWDFRNAAEKLDELIYDERFESTRDDIADQLRSQLLVAWKTSDRQLDDLGKAPTS